MGRPAATPGPPAYTVTKPEFFYASVKLSFEEPAVSCASAVHFKNAILNALRELFGEVGGVVDVDVLKYEADDSRALLRVHRSGIVTVWAAMTLKGSVEGRVCAFEVERVSPFLAAMSGPCRDWPLEDL